jgi:hypothetical protein
MNARLQVGVGMAVGSGSGTAVYQLARYGVAEIDWVRVLFVALATFAVLFLVPPKWLERARG